MAVLESQQSSQVSATASDVLAPEQVTGLGFTVGQGTVDLSWSAVTQSELVTNTFSGDGATTSFQLEYVDVSAGSYTVTVGGVTQTEGSTADYTMDATNGVVTFNTAPASGTGNISVEYRQVLSDLSKYVVYRKRPADTSFAVLAEVASTTSTQTTTYTDTTALDGSTYDYAIAAADDEATPNEGLKSGTSQIKTVPSVPTGLTPSTRDGKIILNWTSVKDGAQPALNENLAGYNVYRSTTDGSGYTNIGNVATGTVNYEDTTVTNGTTYYYVITAYDDSI